MTLSGDTSRSRTADREHAARCARCAAFLRKNAAVTRILSAQRDLVPPPGFEERLLRRLHHSIEAGDATVHVPWIPSPAAPWRWAAAAALVVLAIGLGWEGVRRSTESAGRAADPGTALAAETHAPAANATESSELDDADSFMADAHGNDVPDTPFHYLAAPTKPMTVRLQTTPLRTGRGVSTDTQLIGFEP